MQDTFLIHPAMPKVERPLSGGIWRVKKTPSYLRRQEGESLNLNLNFFSYENRSYLPRQQIINLNALQINELFLIFPTFEG